MSHRDVPTKSYIAKIPTTRKIHEKETRKTSVKDSLMKFLDDCGNEDLVMTAAYSPPKRSMNLSISEHGPSHSSTFDASATTKRRGTKKDREKERLAKLSPGSDHGPRGKTSLSSSEHGTPSTQKASLDALTIDARFEQGSVGSNDGSFASGGGEMPLDDHNGRPGRRQSSSARSKSRSSSRSARERMSGSRSNRMERSRSERDSNHRSSRDSGGTRDVRRSKSDSINKIESRSLARQLSGIDRQEGTRRRRSMAHGDDDNRSVSSSRSSFTTISARPGASLGLDAGPLNAFLHAERRPSMHNGGSSASVGPGYAPSPQDEKFLKLRKERQDEILNQAQKDRVKAKKSQSTENEGGLQNSPHGGIPDAADDDQPMVKNKSSALAMLRKGLSKTGQVTKNTAKGTVNVVMDPKRAAIKVGGFAKDVGKETGKMLMDPKLAAKTAVSLGKDVTVGTYKVTKGVGKGVAKGGIGLTKTVAMTGVNATTMVVGTALDGAGKVMNGATGLIFKSGQGDRDDDYAEYKASELESRRKSGSSLLDRITTPTNESSEFSTTPSSSRNTRIKNHGLSTLLVSNGKKDSWDF